MSQKLVLDLYKWFGWIYKKIKSNYVVALPFLISEWSGFLRSARRFKSYDRFSKEGHEGRTRIFLDFPYVRQNGVKKSSKNGYF